MIQIPKEYNRVTTEKIRQLTKLYHCQPLKVFKFKVKQHFFVFVNGKFCPVQIILQYRGNLHINPFFY